MTKQTDSSSAASRRTLLATAGALAALAGAGMAWWRFSPRTADAAAEAEFWALRLETPEGRPLALDQFKGAPLLVNFWATWCPPCIEELPLLNEFHRENSAKGWQVIGLAVDQLASVRTFLGKQILSFPVAMAGATGTSLSKSLGNTAGGLPFSVIFGADGRIIARKIGRLTAQDLAVWRDLK